MQSVAPVGNLPSKIGAHRHTLSVSLSMSFRSIEFCCPLWLLLYVACPAIHFLPTLAGARLLGKKRWTIKKWRTQKRLFARFDHSLLGCLACITDSLKFSILSVLNRPPSVPSCGLAQASLAKQVIQVSPRHQPARHRTNTRDTIIKTTKIARYC